MGGITDVWDRMDEKKEADEVKLKTQTITIRDPKLFNLLNDCIKILDVKGNDYTVGAGDKDRLFNFRSAAQQIGGSMLQVWYVYFYKHLTSVQRYVKDGKVESEPIRERIKDLINYLYLLTLIIDELEGKGK